MIRAFIIMTLVFSGAAQAVTWSDFLRGHWITDCSRNSKGSYTQNGYTFSDFTGPEFQMVLQGVSDFSDSKCSKVIFYGQNLGHLNLKADKNPMKGTIIHWQIDPLIQFPFAYYDKKVVDDLNAKAYCGQTDWQVGRAKDLLQTSCSKDIKAYYSTSWFSLEVTDVDHLRLLDKSGSKEEITRSYFALPKPAPTAAPGE